MKDWFKQKIKLKDRLCCVEMVIDKMVKDKKCDMIKIFKTFIYNKCFYAT
jgi:Holliday junction resolvasome RuvABC endonuclease subunit